MNFEAIVGLEIHVEMKTKSKMFSSAPVTFGKTPNTMVVPFDMAFPGTLPTVNKQAVINAIRVCHALHMSIDNELWFDRKNYFYSDLPKGYQITQKARPIGRTGYVEIDLDGQKKRINFERLHIEEDACKQVHYKDCTLLDYNRAGIPLAEIVSLPEIHNGKEAMLIVDKIRSIVSFLDVSSGKMEEGTLRCDVNVSIRPYGCKTFGTVVEIKNINTLTNIQRAIDYEIKRQEALLLSGQIVKKETRRYDESKKQTVLMRNKTDDVDYKYFTEPNIPPIKLLDEFIKEAIASSPELAESKYQRYLKLGLLEREAKQLTSDKDLCNYFDKLIEKKANAKLAANWLLVDIQSVLNKNNVSINDFSISPSAISGLLILVEQGKINNKQARELFSKMLITNKTADELIKEIDLNLISNEVDLIGIIKQVINDNPHLKTDYDNGKDKVVGYLVGQVMKRTNGKANPNVTHELVIKVLKEK